MYDIDLKKFLRFKELYSCYFEDGLMDVELCDNYIFVKPLYDQTNFCGFLSNLAGNNISYSYFSDKTNFGHVIISIDCYGLQELISEEYDWLLV